MSTITKQRSDPENSRGRPSPEILSLSVCAKDPLRGHEKYEKVKHLSSGGFGFVQLARNKKNGHLVAIKFLERGAGKVTRFVSREVENHSNFFHPHIVQFYEVFLTREYLAIAMEYVSGGDLSHYVMSQKNGLPESEARHLFHQLITGLDYIHKRGVVNRDIKLENTPIERNDVSKKHILKIADFGYCKSDQDSLPKSRVGTSHYFAPEVLLAKNGYNGKSADIWSTGVMLYVMLLGIFPFERSSDDSNKNGTKKMLCRIINVDYTFPPRPQLSDACKDLIRKILVADPAQRLTIPQIQAHPWYAKHLPASVANMNDACVKFNIHDHPGYPTIQDIQRIVKEAEREESNLTAEQMVDQEMKQA